MKRIAFALCVALLLPAIAFSQAKPAAGQKLILEFVDGPDLTVTTVDNSILKINAGIFEGDVIPVGATISTGPGTAAELRIKPNGSILKLANNTVFTVTAVGATSKDKTALALVTGKVRAVAAKGGNYEMRSASAVCGVRGTDFSFGVAEGAKAVLMVANGLVQFDKLDAAGAVLGSLPIAAGQAADAFAESFQAFAFDAASYAAEFGEMVFAKLKPEEVPPQAQDEEPVAAAAAGAGEEVKEPGKEGQQADDQAGGQDDQKAEAESAIMKWLRETMGMEIGSVTINDETYSKAVIQPNLKLGKVKLGLYLPIIYSADLFDPNDWYWPAGNNEWNFGADKFADGEYVDGALDFAKDLALKIKYFEYGKQLEDPFFVKVGNLNDLTLGHGLIMRDYANDKDFPAIRRIGLNTGLDLGKGGFEALVNDLAEPEIFGLRGFFRPVENFNLAIGFSAVVDIAASADLEAAQQSITGDMWLVGAGVDLDLPIISGDLMSMRFFADGAVIVPYVAEAGAADVTQGLHYELFINDSGAIRNWGAASGLMGKVLFIDYRLEYRYFTGVFQPSFFDGTYDRKRGEYALRYANYINHIDTLETEASVMGVYGEGGFSLLKDKLGLTIGYMLPWAPDRPSRRSTTPTSSTWSSTSRRASSPSSTRPAPSSTSAAAWPRPSPPASSPSWTTTPSSAARS